MYIIPLNLCLTGNCHFVHRNSYSYTHTDAQTHACESTDRRTHAHTHTQTHTLTRPDLLSLVILQNTQRHYKLSININTVNFGEYKIHLLRPYRRSSSSQSQKVSTTETQVTYYDTWSSIAIPFPADSASSLEWMMVRGNKLPKQVSKVTANN